MPNDQSRYDLRSRVIEKLKTLGASEETANKIYDGDRRYDAVAKTLVPQALDLCLIEGQGRIINKLQSLSEGQEKLSKRSNRQNWAIIIIVAATFFLSLAAALHWL